MKDPYLRLLSVMQHCEWHDGLTPTEYALSVLDKEGCNGLFMELNAEQRCIIETLCNGIERDIPVDFSVVPSAFSRADANTCACAELYMYVRTRCQDKGGKL